MSLKIHNLAFHLSVLALIGGLCRRFWSWSSEFRPRDLSCEVSYREVFKALLTALWTAINLNTVHWRRLSCSSKWSIWWAKLGSLRTDCSTVRTEWITVVWSRPPKYPPISSRLNRVRFRASHMQIWRGIVIDLWRRLDCRSDSRTL